MKIYINGKYVSKSNLDIVSRWYIDEIVRSFRAIEELAGRLNTTTYSEETPNYTVIVRRMGNHFEVYSSDLMGNHCVKILKNSIIVKEDGGQIKMEERRKLLLRKDYVVEILTKSSLDVLLNKAYFELKFLEHLLRRISK